MRNNPARLAWIILLSSFITFCVLAVSIPLGIRWLVLHSRTGQPGTVLVTSGTVTILPNLDSDPIAVASKRVVEPGTQIRTDQRSQAALVFVHGRSDSGAGEEFATIQVYPAASVLIVHASRPLFASSPDPARFNIGVTSGRVRIYVTPAEPDGQEFTVTTPHGVAQLAPGSYSIQVQNDQTQVVTRSGKAVVNANGAQITVVTGTTTIIQPGQSPATVTAIADNLLANGNFQSPLAPPSWLVGVNPPDDPTAGSAEIVGIGGRSAALLRRVNQPPTHSEVALTQVLDRSVHDYDALNLQMDVLLRWQSLPGAGERSSEFPLMFRLDYEDIYGNHQFWTHGFYYQDPLPQWVITGGEKIPQNIWFSYESGNLLERLSSEGLPPPATLNYLRIYASGHNFESLVAEVRLIGR